MSYIPMEVHGICPDCGAQTSFSWGGHDPYSYDMDEDPHLGDEYFCDQCRAVFYWREITDE